MRQEGQYGAVASGHPVTSEAAAFALQQGGNAFDGIVAAIAAACVAEPVLASLGGGGFLLAAPEGQQAKVFDFFVDTPRGRSDSQSLDFHSVHADFGTARQEFHIGLGACATPGLLAGLERVSQSLCKLALDLLLSPAIQAAREGVTLRPVDAFLHQVVAPIVTASPEVSALFCRSPGQLYEEGEVMRHPDLAKSLERLGREGAAPFYKGEQASALCEAMLRLGGHITQEDFDSYQTVERKPIRSEFQSFSIVTNPPPSSGGLLILFALALLPESAPAAFSKEEIAALASAMIESDAARGASGLADAEGAEEALEAAGRLGADDFLKLYRQAAANRWKSVQGTTHISVIDSAGNAASATLSNGSGGGRLWPGTGIHLNNMLGEEDLNPKGFHLWPCGTRISSMMSPSLLVSPDGRRCVLGSGGSNRIRSAILQAIVGITARGLSLEEAVTAPRIHLERGLANYESGLSQEVEAALGKLEGVEELKPWPQGNLFFGGVHSVARHADGSFEAVGDPRRGGSAIVV